MSEFAVRWIFLLEQNYTYNLSRHLAADWHEGWAFVDRNGQRRLEIHPNGDAVVLDGYAWDGCTPKFSVADIVFGTPDGIPSEVTKKPKTYYASLLHRPTQCSWKSCGATGLRRSGSISPLCVHSEVCHACLPAGSAATLVKGFPCSLTSLTTKNPEPVN